MGFSLVGVEVDIDLWTYKHPGTIVTEVVALAASPHKSGKVTHVAVTTLNFEPTLLLWPKRAT